MKWTTTQPTEAGWYWARRRECHPVVIQLMLMGEMTASRYTSKLVRVGADCRPEPIDWVYEWSDASIPRPEEVSE